MNPETKNLKTSTENTPGFFYVPAQPSQGKEMASFLWAGFLFQGGDMTPEEQVESDEIEVLKGGKNLAEIDNEYARPSEEEYVSMRRLTWIVWIVIILAIFIFLMVQSRAQAEEIDLDKIETIESSGNPLAHNKRDDSRGLYQITPVCLKEYNNFHVKKHSMNDLWSPSINKEIAVWYLTVRIPQMLKHYGIEDTAENRIVAWNAGISYLVKNKPLPKITQDYIKKYQRGGVDFSYLGGIANTLKRSTQQYVANVQAKNKEQAQIAYERIQQILRDLPDTARNRELMDEYYTLIEKIRATGEASLETRKRLSELTSAQGAHIITISLSKRIK
jgi:hypothetical protein